jgi:hypothetical protein
MESKGVTNLPTSEWMTTLLEHVSHVFGLRANPQMLWSHAGFDIASVKNEQAVGDRHLVAPLPDDPVDSVVALLDPSYPIATSQGPGPQPASVGLVDPLPQTPKLFVSPHGEKYSSKLVS